VFLEPTPTPFDLRWRMFGIPVRVHPTFWLLAAFTGWTFVNLGFSYLLLWVVCVFVSILVHELGHITAGVLSGQRGHVVLYSFGGLAIGNYHHTRRWQRVFISLSGPGAGFLLYGLTVVVGALIHRHDMFMDRFKPEAFFLDPDAVTHVGGTLHFLKFINLLWGLLNLLPIFPLDGGQVMREVCSWISPRNGLRFSLGLSFVGAGLIAVYSVMKMVKPELPYPPFMPQFNVLLFGLLALQSFQLLQHAEREQRRWERDEDPW
jgi:stage IV sporulation protein FB